MQQNDSLADGQGWFNDRPDIGYLMVNAMEFEAGWAGEAEALDAPQTAEGQQVRTHRATIRGD